jgi:hypothetical protein
MSVDLKKYKINIIIGIEKIQTVKKKKFQADKELMSTTYKLKNRLTYKKLPALAQLEVIIIWIFLLGFFLLISPLTYSKNIPVIPVRINDFDIKLRTINIP